MKRNPSIKNQIKYFEKIYNKENIHKFSGLYFDRNFKFKSRSKTEATATDANYWISIDKQDGKDIKQGFLRFVYVQLPLNLKPSNIVYRVNCDLYPGSFSVISLCFLTDFNLFNSKGVCVTDEIKSDENILPIALPDLNGLYLFYLASLYASEYELGPYEKNKLPLLIRKNDNGWVLDTYVNFVLKHNIASQNTVVEILSKFDYKTHKNADIVEMLYALIEDKLSIDTSILKEMNVEKTITDYICEIISIKNISNNGKKQLLHNLKTSIDPTNKSRVAFEQAMKLPFDKLLPFPKVKNISTELENKIHKMDVVKLRVCEFLAKKELNPNSNTRILCLVGEPGVGKTYFANTLSQVTNLPFFSIAIGGMADSTQLKGITRSYQGSEEGGIAKALIYGECSNPIILLDEIDKISNVYSGSKSAITGALLEILDLNQNKRFKDQFLDLEFDISNVWFIATANSTEQISPPLLDRLEIIEVPSYTFEDKIQIFDKFLFSEALIDCGIDKFEIILSQEDKLKFIKKYDEPGIRKLATGIKTVLSNIALKIVTEVIDTSKPIVITTDYINEVLSENKTSATIGFEIV